GATPAAPPTGGNSPVPTAGAATAPPMPRVDDGYVIVRQAWAAALKQNVQSPEFDKRWKKALHDGVLGGVGAKPGTPKVNGVAVAEAISKLSFSAAPTAAALEAVFATTHLYDGRFGNNPWLQELPQPGTRVVWDNPAL